MTTAATTTTTHREEDRVRDAERRLRRRRRAAGRWCAAAMPPEMPSTTPYSRALVPSVATIGLRPQPADQDAVEDAGTRSRRRGRERCAGNSWRRRRSGKWVTITTASETAPGTDRSMPPCWTTSVCPRPTNGEHRRERQHAQQRAVVDARRRQNMKLAATQQDQRRRHGQHAPGHGSEARVITGRSVVSAPCSPHSPGEVRPSHVSWTVHTAPIVHKLAHPSCTDERTVH